MALFAATLAVRVEVAVVAGGFEKSMRIGESEVVGNGLFPVTLDDRVKVGLVVVSNPLTAVRAKTSLVEAATPKRN